MTATEDLSFPTSVTDSGFSPTTAATGLARPTAIVESPLNYTELCPAFGSNLPSCSVVRDGNGTITAFGRYAKGEIPARPDIAGKGILIAFTIFTVLTLFISISMIVLNMADLFVPAHVVKRLLPLHEHQSSIEGGRGFRRHPSVRAVVLAVVDLQLVALVAYGLHFYSSGVCGATTYHFYVFVNAALMGLASLVLAALVLPNYWKSPITALFRVAATAAVCFFAITFLEKKPVSGYLPTRRPEADDPEAPLLFLPVVCFYDTSLNATIGAGEVDQLDHPYPLVELGLAMVLAAIFAVGVIGQTVFCVLRRREDKHARRGGARCAKWALGSIWVVCWVLCLCIAIWAAVYLYQMRDWADGSGWLAVDAMTGQNPEMELWSFGQLFVCLVLVLVLFAAFEQVWVRSPPSTDSPRPRASRPPPPPMMTMMQRPKLSSPRHGAQRRAAAGLHSRPKRHGGGGSLRAVARAMKPKARRPRAGYPGPSPPPAYGPAY